MLFNKRFHIYHETHRQGAPILNASELTVRYDGRLALDDVSFRLEVGERVAVVGPNGAGKSTLLKVIVGVLPAESGSVHIYGTRPRGHTCIAYIPQRNQVDWSFPVNVGDVVMMGCIGKIGLFRQPRAEDWRFVRESLAAVGMVEYEKRHISELSGGQQQRVFIARALAQEAELMLLDEPLTGLDIPSQEAILNTFDELHARQVTLIVATHDLNLAESNFDRVMLLNKQMLGFGPPQEVITPDRLLEAYGGQMRLVETEEGVMMVESIHHHE